MFHKKFHEKFIKMENKCQKKKVDGKLRYIKCAYG